MTRYTLKEFDFQPHPGHLTVLRLDRIDPAAHQALMAKVVSGHRLVARPQRVTVEVERPWEPFFDLLRALALPALWFALPIVLYAIPDPALARVLDETRYVFRLALVMSCVMAVYTILRHLFTRRAGYGVGTRKVTREVPGDIGGAILFEADTPKGWVREPLRRVRIAWEMARDSAATLRPGQEARAVVLAYNARAEAALLLRDGDTKAARKRVKAAVEALESEAGRLRLAAAEVRRDQAERNRRSALAAVPDEPAWISPAPPVEPEGLIGEQPEDGTFEQPHYR